MYRKQTIKNMGFWAFILFLVSLTIGYAIIETNLNVDSVGVIRENTYNLYDYVAKQAIRDDKSSTYVTSSSGISFADISSNTNGKGIYMISSTENDEYPIYYYRGNVDDNNVIFAGFCWQIVRTTETGGTKLIYNGVPNNGACDATGTDATIGLTAYNNNTFVNAVDAGYMFDSNGDEKDDADSLVKISIDTWYTKNLQEYEKYLEDTVWCNDRSVYLITDHDSYYNAYNRFNLLKSPTLVCQDSSDKFTVNVENGNGLLKYPIGLLTSDEIHYAGSLWAKTSDFYLDIGTENFFWLLSPMKYWYGDTVGYCIAVPGGCHIYHTEHLVRPAISLKLDVVVSNGDGTSGNPYIIET